ncbi:condensin subunit [Martiniozyma asiatica (nom. inval.)]|nr:condensin subunit [Martiniozyma asiatica]
MKQNLDDLIREATNGSTWETPVIDYFSIENLTKNDRVDFKIAGVGLVGCTSVLAKRIEECYNDGLKLISGLDIKQDEKLSEEIDKNDPDYNEKKNRVSKKQKSQQNSWLLKFSKIKAESSIFEKKDPIFQKFIAQFDEGGTKALSTNKLRINDEGMLAMDDCTLHAGEVIFKDEPNKSINVDNKLGDLSQWIEIVQSLENSVLCNGLEDIKRSIVDEQFGEEFVKKSMDKLESEGNESLPVIPQYDINDYMDQQDFGDFESTSNLPDPDINDVDMDLQDKSNSNSILKHSSDNKYDASFQNDLMNALDKRFSQKKKSKWSNDWKVRNLKKMVTRHDLAAGGAQLENAFKSETLDRSASPTIEEDGVHEADQAKSKQRSKKELLSFNLNDLDTNSTSALTSASTLTSTTANAKMDTDAANIFQKGTRLTRSLKQNNDQTTMVDINTWNSQKLVRSFIKPKRKYRQMFSWNVTPFEADQEFWANQYNDVFDKDAMEYINDDLNDEDDEDDEKGEGSSYSKDEPVDFDLPDNDYDFELPFNNSLSQENSATHQSTQSRWKKDIKFARRSKRVDVQLLKQNISQTIEEIDLTYDEEEEEKEAVIDKEENEQSIPLPHKVKKKMMLSEIVKRTAEKYNGREKQDLSTSFYFICMLHLANENGYFVESIRDGEDAILCK